ncbi:hypothetical protein [Mycolicibacterium lutetiense]|uniref:Uncharacterized protein n=1 Tax=Mycolicibacterium lutetiense TaxID=1641992 RepID=A0ABS5A1P3_9MYCO|nr:hypothetical protein [Mycolicibacterium lutetiense]MBP2455688.1 hypothetical protein [Mycolicibacterium lutetiense]
MSRPNVDQLDRDALDDRGLVDDDNTPDMRTAPEIPVLAHRAGTDPNHSTTK